MRACLLPSQTCRAIGQRRASVMQGVVFVDPKARTARPLPTTVASTPLPRQHSGQLLVPASVATESGLSVAGKRLCACVMWQLQNARAWSHNGSVTSRVFRRIPFESGCFLRRHVAGCYQFCGQGQVQIREGSSLLRHRVWPWVRWLTWRLVTISSKRMTIQLLMAGHWPPWQHVHGGSQHHNLLV